MSLRLQLMKATMLAESSLYFVFSTDMSQVGVALFPSFQQFSSFTFPGFPFILIFVLICNFGFTASIRAKIEVLQQELADVRNRRQQQELEIANIENYALRQRFQDILDNLLTEQLEKEQQVSCQMIGGTFILTKTRWKRKTMWKGKVLKYG